MTKKSKDIRLKQLLRLGICAALIALITMVGTVMASAEDVKYSKGLAFRSNGDGTCYVNGIGKCTDTDIVIPPVSPAGDRVTGIGDGAFENNKTIVSIVIPEGVTSIAYRAFGSCTSLTNVSIPESVTSIGYLAFSGCSNLVGVYIPSGVTNIEPTAFGNCPGIIGIMVAKDNPIYHSSGNCIIETASKTLVFGCKNSTIPTDGSVTSIGNSAFIECSQLTDITLPESVTSIGSSAFSGCSNLVGVYIPSGVTNIEPTAFDNCPGIIGIMVAKDNPIYHSSGNCIIETASKTLVFGCKNSTIPTDGSVTSIGNSAFSGCSQLTDITLPEGITRIGGSAFYACSGLTDIIIPEGVIEIGGHAFSGCSQLTDITLPEGITRIGESAFSNCSGLTDIIIPEGVIEIGDYAFSNCDGLTSVVIPKGVTVIGHWAFSDCDNLVSVVLPEGLTNIGFLAFGNCTNLTSINIPDSTTEVRHSFEGCTKLFDIDNGIQYVGKWAVGVEKDAKDAVELVLRDNTVGIGAYAFSGNEMTSIVIPDNVKYIGYEAFSWCWNLTSVIFTETSMLTGIGELAFGHCHNLKSICIPSGVKYIEDGAFAVETDFYEPSVTDIYYFGTEAEWNQIIIGKSNNNLLNATIHFLGDIETKITSASLTLGDSLSLNYYATLTPAHTAAQMRFTYHGETITVDGILDETTGEYKFTLGRIPPQCMGDNVKAELILVAEDGTETVLDVKESYSIREYCDDALAANPNNEALATLLADLLAYGDAAQDYANYNEDTPVSEGFEVAPTEWEDVTDTDFTLSDKTREELCFTAAGVRFGYVNRVYFKIKAADLTGVTLTVNGKTYTADDLTLGEDTADTYIFYTEAVYATEFDKVFTAELSADGEVIQTVTYSVKSYVCAKQNSNDTEIAALVKALYNYGRSAIAYKNAQ